MCSESTPHRRRGEALREAVFAAALVEIGEVGVRGASMDSIAHRAGTGKAALYRRWPNVGALALDVFISTMTQALPSVSPNSGSLRGDLLLSLTAMSRQLDSDLGIVVRELISEAAHDPALSIEFQARFGMAKYTEALSVLQQAIARGEIPLQAVDPYIVKIPAALVVHQLVMTGRAPNTAEVEHIIDAIMLPLLRNPAGTIVTPQTS